MKVLEMMSYMYKKVFILILVIFLCVLGIFSYKTYKQNNRTISHNEIEQNEILEEKDLVNVPEVEEIIQEEQLCAQMCLKEKHFTINTLFRTVNRL